jgi:hypothetical protein
VANNICQTLRSGGLTLAAAATEERKIQQQWQGLMDSVATSSSAF